MKRIVKLLKCHGGKYYLADLINEIMHKHLHYVETHFYGGAVLFRKNPNGVSEVANDINGRIMNFWNVIRGRQTFQEFTRLVEATPFSADVFGYAMKKMVRTSVEEAWAFFVQMRQSRQGLGKCFATMSRNRTRRGMNEQVSSWLNAVEGLPDVHKRLQRVVLLNEDANVVIRQQDGKNTLFYCDPTYLHETRNTTNDYEFEMTPTQHMELLETLSTIEGKFILSGYLSKMYFEAERKNGWYRLDVKIDNKASGKKTKEIKTECLWTNYSVKS